MSRAASRQASQLLSLLMLRSAMATDTKRTGISNRETPDEEARERQEHPPIDSTSEAESRSAETSAEHVPDRQTSNKAGVRSVAQKEDRARYPDRGMPATHKKPGAFGREPVE
jgi:hypothetical protein